jgi:hypothetical protein
MTDNHSQSFFGQSTGLIIRSSSKAEPFIFLTVIKKKPDGNWEKPSNHEGKTVRCSLEEMTILLKVLKHNINSWSIYHTYREENTPISFNWEGNGKNKLWINIGNYSKLLNEPQIELFQYLLKHLIKEKIEFGTVSNKPKLEEHNKFDTESKINIKPEKIDLNSTFVETTIIKNDNIKEEKATIKGYIKAETEKALLIVFDSGQEIWIPKSTIHSKYKPEVGINQSFLTDSWILKRNNISA